MTIFADNPFDDPAAMKDFLFANSLSHSQIGTKMEQIGKPIPSYPLNDVSDEKGWLNVHYEVHQDEFAQLGLIGLPDLTDVDFKNPESYQDWMGLHALVHATVNQALGITT